MSTRVRGQGENSFKVISRREMARPAADHRTITVPLRASISGTDATTMNYSDVFRFVEIRHAITTIVLNTI